jgi:hypothetical protein
MKKLLLIPLFAIFFCSISLAQDSEKPKEKKWEFSADMNMYFYPGDFVLLPVFRADRNKLHLEARYNYEDMETFSGWIGYNLKGGNEFEYFITPMIGGVAGNTNGIAPGLEFTFGYKGFELYNESEYLFDLNSNIGNFSYTWTDFSYSLTDWLWLGVSGQSTKIYQEDLLFEGGILLGGGYKNFELTGYLYNPGAGNRFALLTLSANF